VGLLEVKRWRTAFAFQRPEIESYSVHHGNCKEGVFKVSEDVQARKKPVVSPGLLDELGGP
jgi:hypothetical protein